jgi:hypothetical protein
LKARQSRAFKNLLSCKPQNNAILISLLKYPNSIELDHPQKLEPQTHDEVEIKAIWQKI